MCSLSHSSSLTRVRSVQRLLDALEIDAVLCIPGVDSNYNDGCWRLYSYLLCDLSGDELEQIELGPSPEEEDTFLLITSKQISVYCHPDHYSSIVTRLARWHPDMSLYCDLSYPDREDTDHFEVFKITSFIEMTQGVDRIGVPFGRGARLTSKEVKREFSPMSVEQWPLIQAYALEEMGGLGFFTMSHNMRDVTDPLEQLYSQVDPLSVRYLQKRGAKLFSKQWEDLIDGVSRLEPDDVMKLSEQSLLSGMRVYLQHAKLSRQSDSRAKGYAYVVVGQNSQKLKYKPCPVASNLSTVGTSEGVAQHCVVELSDPLLPLATARTFFFSQNHSPYQDSDKLRTNSDHEYLLLLYRDLVNGVTSILQSVCNVVNVEELRELASSRLRVAVDRQIGIVVSITPYDVRKVELSDSAISHKNVYYLRAMLTDIMSPSNPTIKLGAIVYGESFVISQLQIQSDTDRKNECQYLILSDSIPVLVTWADRESQLLRGSSLKVCLQSSDKTQLGDLISLAVSDVMLSTSFIEDVLPVKLHVMSAGLMLQSSVWKFLWLPWVLIEHVKLIKVSNEEKQLQIFPNPQYMSYLPAFLQTDHFSLLYPPTGTEHSRLHREIIGFLRSVRAGELFSYQELDSNTKLVDSVIHDFYQHSEISCLYDGCVSNTTLSYISPAGSYNENAITVHVVVGLPGSNADSLATFIVEKTRGDMEWILVSFPSEHQHVFDKDIFQTMFQSAVEECLEKKEKKRILVMSPCFSTPSQVVEALLSHPGAASDSIIISGVTLCIGLVSSFRQNNRLHPLVMQSIRPGVVSNIIITGYQEQLSANLTQLLYMCRAVATGAVVIQTTHISELSTEDIACMLSDQFSRLATVRCWYNPCIYSNSALATNFSTEYISIKCSYYMSDESLTSALKQLPETVQFVRGQVNLGADTPIYHHLEMAQSYLRLYPISCVDMYATSTVTFYGDNLDSIDLMYVLQSSLPADKQKLTTKSEHNLTREELNELEVRCKNAPLPEGVFFNGYQYVGFDGDRWHLHPCRQDIVCQYLVELNEKIDSHNQGIDRFYKDIFSN